MRLVTRMTGSLRVDIWLFAQGGLAILKKIRELEYDVWSTRPRVSPVDRLRLLARGWWLQRRGRLAEPIDS